jgi:L-ascorbate metabolism protein UlaG (beta-lactamase superfamily)
MSPHGRESPTDYNEPRRAMSDLIRDIEAATAWNPTLWYLGAYGFVIKYRSIVFIIDPSTLNGVSAQHIDIADMLLRTHLPEDDYDAAPAILAASPRAKVIIPKSAADAYYERGVPYDRMTTTDSDLRVEYFKGGVYGRVYSVPSAKKELAWTALGGYPYLGYLIRFGNFTIYHPGASRPYEGLTERLRPYHVTIALIPVGSQAFSVQEAAQLAELTGTRWLTPMGCGADTLARFTDHMLGHRPAQRFKIFQENEAWPIPEE